MKETYGRKKYIDGKIIHNVREQYRTRVSMQAFAGNYSHDNRFSNTQWKCRCETSIESEAHLMEGFCPVYGKVRQKYDNLEDDESLIKLFNEILSIRENLEEEERKEEKERKERKEKEKKRS